MRKIKDKDYLNIKLNKKERKLLEEKGKEFLNNYLVDIAFKGSKYPIELDLSVVNDIERKFMTYLDTKNSVEYRYITKENYKKVYEILDIEEILEKRILDEKITTEKCSRLFIEILIYLELIKIKYPQKR